MAKLYGLFVRWLFVSGNGIKIQFLGVVGSKSSTLTVYCLRSWFVYQIRNTYLNLCVLVDSVIYHYFRDLSTFHPHLCLKSQIMTLSQKCQKSDFSGHCSFTQLVHDVEKLRRKPKTNPEVIQRFLYVQHEGLLFFLIHQKQPNLQLW